MVRSRALLAVALGALLLPQPASAALFDDEEARARIEQLRREQAARIDKLEARLEASAGGSLELSNQLEALRQELARIRGQIEVLNFEVEQSKKRQKDFYVDLDNRVRRLEQTPVKVEPAPAPALPDPAAEAKAYEAALNLFKAAKYNEAIPAFEAFMRAYPLGSYAPGALYWKAQAHYQLRDCPKALDAFRKLALIWPNDAKAPEALLGAALCEQETGDLKGARVTLGAIVSRYPNSPAAASARERLKPRKK
ncbi:MAG: tol-pal system protein YbgF [Rhodocyclaceae bacterium]